jgi:hypothetical protein
MKHFLIILTLLFTACSNNKNYVPATDALNAAVEFVSACQQGNFEKAAFYMLTNNNNKKLLQEAEQTYRKLPAEKRRQYREASLQEVTIENISATETIINYKNSYDKVGRKVKAIQQNNNWVIDFEYSFNPNL